MPDLLRRQESLLAYLTSGPAIFGGARNIPADPTLAGIDTGLLYLEARFSHDKRMAKISSLFPRTLTLLGEGRDALIRAFTESCPPDNIGHLENSRQFQQFLAARWRAEPPQPAWLPDVAACELAWADVRREGQRVQSRGGQGRANQAGGVPRGHVRRTPGIILMRGTHDVRKLFEAKPEATHLTPPARDTCLSIAMPPGALAPFIAELQPTVFDLLAQLDEFTDRATLDAQSQSDAMIAVLAEHGLVEIAW